MLTDDFRKSSYSQPRGECVAARLEGPGVAVADTATPGQSPVALSREAWVALLASLRG
ncbi:DUF397 domain-containing protein [Nocardiopsis sp. CNT-189]|uniref:DUF397 domain-containing protein n=1 Tax=Nocardiopsis oceanisediminis TaxID=2816862 RepID=UPI003B3604AD